MLSILQNIVWWRSRIADYHVYSTTPDCLLALGADSWQCKSTNHNLDNEQAREVALELESEGYLVRVVPDQLCQSYNWRVS